MRLRLWWWKETNIYGCINYWLLPKNYTKQQVLISYPVSVSQKSKHSLAGGSGLGSPADYISVLWGCSYVNIQLGGTHFQAHSQDWWQAGLRSSRAIARHISPFAHELGHRAAHVWQFSGSRSNERAWECAQDGATVFLNLISEEAYHHFPMFYLLEVRHRPRPCAQGEGITQGVNTRRQGPWGSS